MPSLIDASSAIYAWDNYPIELFPDLWKWLAKPIDSKEIQCIAAIMGEIRHKSPECHNYFNKHNINVIPIGDLITQRAFKIMKSLGLNDAKYHPKGVNENDIFIIATAAVTNKAVISNEGIQTKAPRKKSNYKIPLVCKQESVQCYSFISYLKAHWKSV